MGGADVFVGGGAADGGLVNADDLRDGVHGEGSEFCDAFFEKFALMDEEFAGDAFDGLLALLNGIDQEFSGAEAFEEKFLFGFTEGAFGEHGLVGAVDPELGDVIVVEVHLPLVVFVEEDGDIGVDDGVAVGSEAFAGGGVEPSDLSDGVLDFIGFSAGEAGEFGDAAPYKEFEVFAQDAAGEACFVVTEAGELGIEAIPEVCGSDSGGVKGLEAFGGRLHESEGEA